MWERLGVTISGTVGPGAWLRSAARIEDPSGDLVLVDVQVADEGEWTIVSVVGELDLAVAPRIRHAVAEALGPSRPAPEPRRVVLDLGSVHFIDSSGLGIVLGVLRRVRLAGGDLRVVVAEAQVTDLFALLSLDTILEVHPSVRAAIAAPAAPPASTAPVAAESGRHG